MLNHIAQEEGCILNSLLGNFEDMELSDRITKAIKTFVDASADNKQGDIATYCGVTPGSITQWKNGQTKNLKFDNLFRLADLTGFSPRWLAIGEGPERSAELPGVQLTSSETALLAIFRGMPQDKQEILFGAISGINSVKTTSALPKTKDRKEVKATGS